MFVALVIAYCTSTACTYCTIHVLLAAGAAHPSVLRLLEEVAGPDLKAGLSQAFEAKAVVLEGDLAKPLLGLDEAVFADLASSVDVIIHNGAYVNHVLPYQSTCDRCCACVQRLGCMFTTTCTDIHRRAQTHTHAHTDTHTCTHHLVPSSPSACTV